MKKVSVMILNYKQKELTVNCVKSVIAQGYKNLEIIVIDNGSNDGSFELFKKTFGNNSRIKLVALKENTGYTGGNNEGYKHATGEYVVILNNDTIVAKNWLSELIAALESGEKVAMATSIVINVPSLKNLSQYKQQVENRIPWTTTLLCYWSRLKVVSRFMKTFAVHGGSFIFKRKLFKTLFDNDYFAYSEETKLSWQTRLKGYDVIIARDSIFYHQEGTVKKSNKSFSKYFTFLGERNRVLNLLTFYSGFNLIRLFPLFLINVLLLNLSEIRKMPFRLKSYFWLLFHPGFVLKKRKEVQRQRKVSDKEIFSVMGYKLIEEPEKGISKWLLKVINYFFKIYCKILFIRTMD